MSRWMRKKKICSIFLGTIGRLTPRERCQRKLEREKKPFCFGCWGRWGFQGTPKASRRISKDLGKGYIYIYVEQQARGTPKDAMGIKNDAKKLWEKKKKFWAREANKEDTMQCSWAHYQ